MMMMLSFLMFAIVAPTSTFGQSTTRYSTQPYPSVPNLSTGNTSFISTGINSTSTGSKGYNVVNHKEKLVAVNDQQQSDSNPLQVATTNCYLDTVIQGYGYDTNIAENGSPSIPPDPSGAAGAERLVAVVNSMIEVRTKNGALTFRDSLKDFFTSLGTSQTGSRVFDPKVVYDEHEGRFVVVALQFDDISISRTLLAVSKNERPDSISEWHKFAINSAQTINNINSWADYPGFEVDDKAVYITANMYTFGNRAYQGVRLWIVTKGVSGGFYDGGTPIFSGPYDPIQSGGGIATTTMPAQVHGQGGTGIGMGTFLVACLLYNDGDAVVQIFTILNPLDSPTFSRADVNLGVITQKFSHTAPQKGSSMLLDAGDVRTLDSVWRSNKLWMTITINPPTPDVNANRATAHWVRIDTTSGVFTLEAQGNLGVEAFARQTSTFYPAVAINTKGEVGFGYSASSPTTYAGAHGSILLGTTELPFTVQNGLDYYYRDFGRGRNRWGDYTGISVDPIDDSFWIFNEFADVRGLADQGRDGRWGTAWGRVFCTSAPIGTPISALSKVPISALSKVPISAPNEVPISAPSKVPISAPSKVPTNAPIEVLEKCGIFGLSIFCPFTFCGLLGRLLGLCNQSK